MAFKERDKKCLTFLWKLKNISFCSQKHKESINSPKFVIDEIEKTKWHLSICPRGLVDGDYIGCYLHGEAPGEEARRELLRFEIAFISKEGSVIKAVKTTYNFPAVASYGFHFIQKRKNVFIYQRSTFLPKDTLRIRCRIWKVAGDLTNNVRCTACTRIGIEKRSFVWSMERFSLRELEKKYTYEIKSTENDAPLMSVSLVLTGILSLEEIVHFELCLQDKTIKYCTLRLFLIDAEKNRIQCNKDEFWFDSLAQYNKFQFIFTKQTLMARKSKYLPDDTLSLYWEWTFSRGVESETTVELQYGSISYENKTPNVHNMNNGKETPSLHPLNNNLKSLYNEQFFCDISLKTSTSIFPAHKVILGASSPVFKAMFLNDMKEKDSDCINIQEVSDDAVRRMLQYVYASRMEDLTWKSASDLYVTADKYAIISLKNICSSYLKNNLSSGNACELLLLADFYADNDLKRAVQDYILKHDKNIINSDEWKSLVEKNGKLAAETVCIPYE